MDMDLSAWDKVVIIAILSAACWALVGAGVGIGMFL